jgi:SWIM/SEC-C metal-binding protein
MERAEEILSLCQENGWQVIVGIEPDKPENIDDIKTLLSQDNRVEVKPRIDRNAPCPCGSRLKYKRCCWVKDRLR